MALIDNLVAYFKLDEASGTRADAHDNNDLTDNNTVTSAAGKINDAAQFTAANSEYLSIADNADMSTGDIDFTFNAWFYLDDLVGSQRPILGKWETYGNYEYILIHNESDNRLYWIVSHEGESSGAIIANTFGALSASTWYMVTAWHDSVNNEIAITVNAGTADIAGHTLGVFNSTAAFSLGRNDDGEYYMNGRIDEVGFWKRVLTSGERTELYNAGAGLAYPFSAAAAAHRLGFLGVGA